MLKSIILPFFYKKIKLDWKYDSCKEHFLQVEHHRKRVLDIINHSKTPLFITDHKIIANRYEQLKSSLNNYWGDHLISFSFKTNYSVAQNSSTKKLGLAAEVVSEREYKMAKKLGYKKIIFNGPFKTKSSYLRAIKDRSLIHIDNFSEIKLLKSIPIHIKKDGVFGLRVSTQYNKDGRKSRFGFSIDNNEADKALREMKKMKLNVQSLHIHLGADVPYLKFYKKAASKLADFIIKNQLLSLKFIDFGGGFPAHSQPPHGWKNWQIPPIEEYIAKISFELKRVWPNTPPTLILEPGRYLVGDSTIAISKIIDVKVNQQEQEIIVDSTIIMLTATYLQPQILKIFTPRFIKKKTQSMKTTIFGASCKEDDLLFEGNFNKASVGDYLVHYSVGAYNQNLVADFIFEKPKSVFI